MSEICQLSINVSSDIVEELMSHLSLIPEWVTGCTCVAAKGFRHRQHYRNIQEKICGATERNLILMILPQASVILVLAHIKQKFKSSDCFYWVLPVMNSGYIGQGVLD
ncbi:MULTISPECIES: DUF3240 family protein [unclassified Acinetobacter]|uniref:DUF3240 family protein n=1 Tax=unclassified Acinetobacter TaxID=196816 RepID=UPI002934A160|nr:MULTISPECIES: DUF3240 family protein [unclassified Acinetobacter]WOE31517.1 DUF3240 family protein [Acinetobacter sp. SAAs470]WOE39713.1 DUF3240 family protein [Acinetobacter sp. SAAs474]